MYVEWGPEAVASAARVASADPAAVAAVKVPTRSEVVSTARYAMAATVAAAASAAAEVTARSAVAAQSGTMIQATKVAAAAVAALESIIADLPEHVAPQWARGVASVVAATVTADVLAQTRLADDAAGRVSDTVALAAEGAALAALAAATVGLAAQTPAGTAPGGVDASGHPDAASNVAVQWTAKVSELAVRRASFLSGKSMVVELEHALDRDEFRLHYQPIYDVRTGVVVAVEALLRWQHPTRGLLPPAEFIAVAEGPPLAAPVGDWVLAAAAKQASQWQRNLGERAPQMWVNISCEQLGHDHLVGVVKQLLDDDGLMPGSFGLEVTERQLVHRIDDVLADLAGLRALGVPLAVDDFGTGYASMDYLRRFVFDEIKIDRSFVAGLPDRVNSALISSMIALGGALGLNVIVEGVETAEELNQLEELGCRFAQGYLWHRPATADTITTLLHA